jgi:thioredoxin:protein disulfide reductase
MFEMRVQMTNKRNEKIARSTVCVLSAVLMSAALLFAQAAHSQELPPPSRIASPQVHVAPATVAQGGTFEVTLDVGIMTGFHMNAHKPSEDYLIPTTLTAKLPAGFKELDTTYPPGIAKKLSFTDKPLLVYTDKFTVRAKFAAEANARVGKVNLPFTLQYQACNDAVCLPPVKVPIDVTVQIASSTKSGS